MKKTLAIMLVLAMIMSMSAVTAFATNDPVEDVVVIKSQTEGEDPSIPLDPVSEDAYVSVNISWDNMTFTYDYSKWNTDSLKYDGAWDKNTAAVTVANDSNVDVVASAEFEKISAVGFEAVNGTLDKDHINLFAALTDTQTDTFELTVAGAPTVAVNSGAQVGIIHVSVEAVADFD